MACTNVLGFKKPAESIFALETTYSPPDIRAPEAGHEPSAEAYQKAGQSAGI